MQSQPTSEPKNPEPRWWCNFCGYQTDDADAYLAHSCRDVLEQKQGQLPDLGTETHCR